ncbi:hypothetical protein C8J56DRAFT_1118861 [Mycena floridula]|nr:hypothetical protein C8J56DRAFT_1118861 [Mycena floridula]
MLPRQPSCSDHVSSASDLKDEVPKSTPTPTEYEAGRVICETCGRGVSFRDDLTGAFSVKHWDAHRLTCSAVGQPSTVIFAEDVHSPHVNSPAKRRRAKRTEEERIEYLRGDPYVAEFEPYKVLCASCDKWIRLRPNSTYCSIPWDAHRKSCLAKKVTGKNVYALEERNTLFSKDPDIRKFDAERVLCATCDKWIPINPDDHLSAVQIWLQHRSGCNKSSGHMPPLNPGSPQHQQQHQTLWSTNPTSTHESRRRNAEQRAATLRSDPLIRFVEPNRVFCSLCLKWVQLRQDSSYCAYPWLQHRGKCLKRSERRAAKNRERGGEKKDKEPPKKKIKLEDDPEELDAEGSEDPDADGEPDDGEMVEMEQTREPVVPRYRQNVHFIHHPHAPPPPPPQHYHQMRRIPHPQYRHAPRPIYQDEARMHMEHHEMREPRESRESREHREARDMRDRERDRERERERESERERSRPAMDLDNINARKLFIAYSITHLFSTTFTPHDDLTISALVSYLNGAMPQDKHEDFDTSEVVKGVSGLSERGRVRLEGDVIKRA